MARGRSSARGTAWAIASAFFFSLSSVVGKDLLPALGVSSLLFWRFGLASVVLWAVLLAWSRGDGPNPFDVPRLKLFSLGMVMGVIAMVGFFALERLDASVYIVLVYLYPAFVVIASTALGKPLKAPTVIALVIITVGVALTVPEVFGGVGTISPFGALLAVGQAVLFAAYMILQHRIVPESVDGVVNAGWTTLGAAAVMAPLALGAGLNRPHGAHMLLEVGLFALIPTVAATTCFFRALGHIAPGIMAMIMTLEVALAIAWSALFLGEHVRSIQVLGAAVVIAGVMIAQRASAAAEATVPAGV